MQLRSWSSVLDCYGWLGESAIAQAIGGLSAPISPVLGLRRSTSLETTHCSQVGQFIDGAQGKDVGLRCKCCHRLHLISAGSIGSNRQAAAGIGSQNGVLRSASGETTNRPAAAHRRRDGAPRCFHSRTRPGELAGEKRRPDPVAQVKQLGCQVVNVVRDEAAERRGVGGEGAPWLWILL